MHGKELPLRKITLRLNIATAEGVSKAIVPNDTFYPHTNTPVRNAIPIYSQSG
jgi:hypothetical protein